MIPHPQSIVIGAFCVIGDNVTIESGVTIGRDFDITNSSNGYPHIGDNVYIGTGAKLIGPVNVGDNSVIGANAVVTKDIPANSVAVGIPAKVIRNIH
jgi:serine O-acetyltransferase